MLELGAVAKGIFNAETRRGRAATKRAGRQMAPPST